MQISNQKISTPGTHVQTSRLSGLERALTVLPLLGGTFFGLFPLLAGSTFASVFGFPGNDQYMYRLAGAATFGYAVALTFAVVQDRWAQMRLLVIAVLAFNLGSLFACGAEIAGGNAQPVVYLVLAASILFIAISLMLLSNHRDAPKATPDIASWVVGFLGVATLLAAAFGIMPLFLTNQLSSFFGFKGTDTFLFRQGGASTLGYAVMGIFELRSRNWEEIRWPALMALVFNGASFVASVVEILAGGAPWLVYLIAPTSLLVSLVIIVILVRRGR